MAASYQTVDEVLTVVKKHVDEKTLLAILTDLSHVKGNSSFETTIKRMLDQARKDHAKKGPK